MCTAVASIDLTPTLQFIPHRQLFYSFLLLRASRSPRPISRHLSSLRTSAHSAWLQETASNDVTAAA